MERTGALGELSRTRISHQHILGQVPLSPPPLFRGHKQCTSAEGTAALLPLRTSPCCQFSCPA